MFSIKKVTLISISACLLVVSKEILTFLPNIELVTFLLIIFSSILALKESMMITTVFCFLQMLLYGVGIWTPLYFIIWNLLVISTYYLKKYLHSYLRCAIFSSLFGFTFGFLFALPYFFIDPKFGWIFFIRGVPFDIVHGIGNFIIMVILYDPLNPIIKKMLNRYLK